MMTAKEITLVLIVPIMKASADPAIQITLSRKGQHIKEGVRTELQVFLVTGCFFP